MFENGFINDQGIIEIIFRTSLDQDSITASMELSKKLAGQLIQEGKPVRILADLETVKTIDIKGRIAGMEFIKQVPYVKIAAYTGSKLIKYSGNLVIKASGRTDKVMMFNSREEALKWLIS